MLKYQNIILLSLFGIMFFQMVGFSIFIKKNKISMGGVPPINPVLFKSAKVAIFINYNSIMVELKDSIEIKTSVNSLYEWLLDLDKHFVEWHPNHKAFEFVSKGKEIGDKIYFEEEVNGMLYAIKGKIIDHTKTNDSFSVAFKTSAGLGHIYFMGKETDKGCVFTHIERFGLSTTIVGNFVNFLLFKVIARKKANWNLILTDMKEDNIRLKEILEHKEIL